MDIPNDKQPATSELPRSNEIPHTPEVPKSFIEELYSRLNFTETIDLAEAKIAIVELLGQPNLDSSLKQHAWTEYAIICEQLVDSVDTGPDTLSRSKLQLALILHKALIFKAADNTSRYIEELDRAETYADDESRRSPDDNTLTAVVAQIREELSRLTDTLELSPEILLVKLKGVITDMNREFLRDGIEDGDDLETSINNAYAMIEDEGGDADEILKELGIFE